MNTITAKRTHFPRTLAKQRKLLFHSCRTSDDVKFACHKAHVSERTFYKWKPRFESGGYEALEQFASHAPKTPHRIKPDIEKKVIELRRTHPKWGFCADEITKSNNWV